MTVSSSFTTLVQNLEFASSKTDSIRTRYKNITKAINKQYYSSTSDTSNSLYVGSYGRGTKVFSSDIDIIVILPYSTYKKFDDYTSNGQSALLQEVKNVIDSVYPNTHIRGDGQVVQLNFTDGISFEILPVFKNTDSSYTYPDTNNGGSWKITDPKAEIDAMNSLNKNLNYNLKKLCKMIRAWKHANDVNISGELIDIHAYTFLKNWEHNQNGSVYHDWMTRDFFNYLKNIKQNSWHFVPGSNRLVQHSSYTEYKALTAYDICVEACNIDPQEYPYSYSSKWKEIYGSKFPSS